jgi:hypothetical protein
MVEQELEIIIVVLVVAELVVQDLLEDQDQEVVAMVEQELQTILQEAVQIMLVVAVAQVNQDQGVVVELVVAVMVVQDQAMMKMQLQDQPTLVAVVVVEIIMAPIQIVMVVQV